jgi:hypothetical protein
MFKTKLLILLLINLIFINSCTTNRLDTGIKYSVGYIGGEYAGFVFKNKLLIHLDGYNLYSKISNYQIRADVNHTTNTYVTNINNTSDRSNIETIMNIEVYDLKNECIVYRWKDDIEQFFIYASNEKFLSNQTASEKINIDNTDQLIKRFINKIQFLDDFRCVK